MINRMYASVVLFSFFTKASYADITIQSPVGGSFTFLRKIMSTTMITYGGYFFQS